MGIMHRETIRQNRANTIIGSIVFSSIMIAIAKFVGEFELSGGRIEVVTDPLFIIVTLIVLAILLRQCKISYKYSVIADQLIIHKVSDNEQEILENIKINDILYLGKEKKKLKKFVTKTTKRYTCNSFDKNNYCCIYNREGKNYKFYFRASDKFVDKINKFKINIEK